SAFFLFTDPAATESYTLSLHDALPILRRELYMHQRARPDVAQGSWAVSMNNFGALVYAEMHWNGINLVAQCHPLMLRVNIYDLPDRKSTRLNSSHVAISYAVFCLKKKK